MCNRRSRTCLFATFVERLLSPCMWLITIIDSLAGRRPSLFQQKPINLLPAIYFLLEQGFEPCKFYTEAITPPSNYLFISASAYCNTLLPSSIVEMSVSETESRKITLVMLYKLCENFLSAIYFYRIKTVLFDSLSYQSFLSWFPLSEGNRQLIV